MFWSLEIIVFVIFVYVWFISAEAPKPFLAQKQSSALVYLSIQQLIGIFFELNTLLVVALFTLIANNYRNVIVMQIGVTVLTLGLVKILISEYHFFVYNSSK